MQNGSYQVGVPALGHWAAWCPTVGASTRSSTDETEENTKPSTRPVKNTHWLWFKPKFNNKKRKSIQYADQHSPRNKDKGIDVHPPQLKHPLALVILDVFCRWNRWRSSSSLYAKAELRLVYIKKRKKRANNRKSNSALSLRRVFTTRAWHARIMSKNDHPIALELKSLRSAFENYQAGVFLHLYLYVASTSCSQFSNC